MMYGLDLFSGIGGITKALEGYVRPVSYCENDRYAQAVLLSRMQTGDLPTAPIWDDVRTLHSSEIPIPPQIIYGGFPCQDISVAGLRAGLEGERSRLFFEIIRLTCEIRPAFVFLENVAAITIRGSERVVGEFCRIGYDARWGILSASDVGAPHRRDRWWLLAHRNLCGGGPKFGKQQTKRAEIIDSSGAGDVADTSRKSGAQKNTSTSTIGKGGNPRADDRGDNGRQVSGNDWWVSEPDVDRVVNGVPFRVDRLRGLGNAVVPACAREAFERLMGLK